MQRYTARNIWQHIYPDPFGEVCDADVAEGTIKELDELVETLVIDNNALTDKISGLYDTWKRHSQKRGARRVAREKDHVRRHSLRSRQKRNLDRRRTYRQSPLGAPRSRAH